MRSLAVVSLLALLCVSAVLLQDPTPTVYWGSGVSGDDVSRLLPWWASSLAPLVVVGLAVFLTYMIGGFIRYFGRR